MKVYIASSWRNQQYEAAKKAFENAGYEVLDWRGKDGFSWSKVSPNWKSWTKEEQIEALNHDEAIRGFARDQAMIDVCDLLVLLLPCGKSAHMEMGYATGIGKFVIVILAGEAEAELMYMFADAVYPSVDAAINEWILTDTVEGEEEG